MPELHPENTRKKGGDRNMGSRLEELEYIGFKCTKDMKEWILFFVETGEYLNITEFVRSSVREKLHQLRYIQLKEAEEIEKQMKNPYGAKNSQESS